MYGQFFVIIAMILTGYLMRKINFIKKHKNYVFIMDLTRPVRRAFKKKK